MNEFTNTPPFYLSHKARNDEVDNQLAEAFENVGFYGDQVVFQKSFKI
jgi:hypothetical protein